MLWRLWLSVSLGMATIAGFVDSDCVLRAAEPRRPAESDVGDSLIGYWQAVHFQLVLGRLELDPPRHRKVSKAEERFKPTPLKESFTVTAARGIPSLHYTRRTPTWEVILDVVDANRVQVLSELLETHEHLSLTQPAHGPLKIRLRSAGTEETFSSPSWLHLQSTHPELFDRHLTPLLACLLPDVSLQRLRDKTTVHLLRLAGDAIPPGNDRLVDLIEQLDSSSRRDRQEAYAKLLAYGVSIIPFLDGLPKRELQQEQRLRIDALRRQLRPQQPDNAARVAQWLVTDREYWNAIAADLSREQKIVANRHLQQIHGEGLKPVTEGPTRVAQTPESSNRK